MHSNRQEFLELLQRYINGTCSSEEKQLMDHWYDLLDQEPDENNTTGSEKQQEDQLWSRIQQRIQAVKQADQQRLLYKGWQPDS